jgi:transposase
MSRSAASSGTRSVCRRCGRPGRPAGRHCRQTTGGHLSALDGSYTYLRQFTAGLTPVIYESAGRRRDGGISREGSVQLRRALLDLGIGLWLQDQPARGYARTLRERGKPGGIITCALAKRASRIAFAMVRDQLPYDPARWG